MPRIAPVRPPYDADTTEHLARMMPPGVPPILLFRTFVKNSAMTSALRRWGGYELSERLSLTVRDREILILRTCARCNCEYEWGVHVLIFAEAAGLSGDQVTSVTHGCPTDSCWTSGRDRMLIAAADELHDTAALGTDLYGNLAAEFSEAELLDLMMLCGWYHAISFTANGAEVELEEGAPRFHDYAAASRS